MIINIRLKSALCVQSGELYNATVDIDSCYEEHGIPYIPAKRIKGCIREAALELVEFGLYSKDTYEQVFGKEGVCSSGFSLSNAYIEHYDDICKEIETCPDKVLVHLQRVLAQYTYIRNHNSLERDMAKDTTLRNIRVVKRGLLFQAEISVRNKLSEEGISLLKDAVANVKHIGLSRTRGLGLVDMKLDPNGGEHKKVKICSYGNLGERNKIDYSITLKSAVLCKSDEGNQNQTKQYLEGSKILGLLAGQLGAEKYQKLMESEVVVSNAYIANERKRCTPTSAALFKNKGQQFDKDGKMNIINRLVKYEGHEQLTPIGFAFMDADKRVKSVSTEINYHHRRSEDKSLGKADGKDASAFYQLESISSGQIFRGYIMAGKEQTETILKAFSEMENVRMGYGRSTEYGKVEITIENVQPIVKLESLSTQRFAIKLNAPTILYNENAMAVASVELLKKELEKILNVHLVCQEKFLAFTTISGFNVTWHRKKPVIRALDSGTTCVFEADGAVDISSLKDVHIGERVSEGYGEIEIMQIPKKAADDDHFNDTISRSADTVKTEKAETDYILQDLRYSSLCSDIRLKARLGAEELAKGKLENMSTPVNRLFLMMKTEHTLTDIKKEVDAIEKDQTRQEAIKILNTCNEALKQIDSKTEITGTEEMLCLREMLIYLKHRIRKQNQVVKEEEKHE